MRKRVVITGASGNVGTALLRRLAAADPGYDVIGIARRKPPPTDVYRTACWHQLDLADPKAITILQRLFRGAHCIVHLAWAFQPSRDPRYLDAVGVGGTSAVLIATHAADIKHLVYVSSAAAYAGAPGQRVDESWSTDGIPTSTYSRAKSAVEALMDEYDRKGDGVAITRLRPGFIVQREAAASIRRHAFPPYLPPRLLRLLPLVPLPLRPSVALPVIHADDVAEACVQAIERRVFGALNLSCEPPVRRHHIAGVIGAMPMNVPPSLIRPLVQASWTTGLQPLDPGWLDLANAMPLLCTDRARKALDWCPRRTAEQALADLAEGLRDGAGTHSPPLARASMVESLWRDVSRGPLSTRRES